MLSILIASNNVHKHQELREIFAMHAVLDVELLTPKMLGFDIDPEENADTYTGNALIKAKAFHGLIKNSPHNDFWVMADDSGLEVDALNGRPGLLSARYHKAAPQGDGCAELLREMLVVSDDQRAARFRAVIAVILPDKTEHLFEGVCEGSIGHQKRGAGGFGFDPVFRVANDSRHLAELSSDEKHRISHRGLAMQQVIHDLFRRKV